MIENTNWYLILNTFIANLPLLVTAVTGLIVVLQKVEAIHRATNSMKDALVEATAKASSLEGHARGVADEQARVRE